MVEGLKGSLASGISDMVCVGLGLVEVSEGFPPLTIKPIQTPISGKPIISLSRNSLVGPKVFDSIPKTSLEINEPSMVFGSPKKDVFFPPLGFKGNLSLLDICSIFFQGT